MTTPHALWKTMCRFAEDRRFVKLFGGDVMKRLSTFAIFDVSQIHNNAEAIDAMELDYDAENPIPPFPFPKIVLILATEILVLDEPQMDLETGVFEYDAMLYCGVNENERQQNFTTCRIRVDSRASALQRELVAETLDYKGLIDDDDLSEHSAEAYEAEVEKTRAMARDMRFPEDARERLTEIADSIARLREESLEAGQKYTKFSFLLGLLIVSWINRPKHYIVRTGPELVHKGRDKDRIPRLGERERYIMIEHDEVRRRWSAMQGNHASPMPHLRRGHYMTLRAERYKENRGKVVWVSPCHVNGACVEWREGNVSYKVVG